MQAGESRPRKHALLRWRRAAHGPTDFKLDGWIGNTRKIFDDRIAWRVQLNVRNVLNEDERGPVLAQPDFSIAAWRIPSPRTFTPRSTFEF